jgi:hypothetical protein
MANPGVTAEAALNQLDSNGLPTACRQVFNDKDVSLGRSLVVYGGALSKITYSFCR